MGEYGEEERCEDRRAKGGVRTLCAKGKKLLFMKSQKEQRERKRGRRSEDRYCRGQKIFCESDNDKQMSSAFALANGVLASGENSLLLIWLGKTRGSHINSAEPQDLGHYCASPYSIPPDDRQLQQGDR